MAGAIDEDDLAQTALLKLWELSAEIPLDSPRDHVGFVRTSISNSLLDTIEPFTGGVREIQVPDANVYADTESSDPATAIDMADTLSKLTESERIFCGAIMEGMTITESREAVGWTWNDYYRHRASMRRVMGDWK